MTRDERMTEPHSRPAGELACLGIALAASLIVAACNPGAPPSSGTSAAATAVASDTSTAAPEAGQTDTDWGRIWDGLPAVFPVYPGATPADDAATELVSATYALEGAEARIVAAWIQAELERATYATESLNGPFEDGSFILESRGTSDCRVQVAVAPLGGLTTVNVRYGAACPIPD